MSSKRSGLSWRVARVGVALTLLLAINLGALAAWQRFFPGISIFPDSQAPADAGARPAAVADEAIYVGKQPENARQLVKALLDISPTPAGEWQALTGEPENLLPAVAGSCGLGSQHTPGLQGQRAWVSTSSSTPSPSAISPSPTATEDGVEAQEDVEAPSNENLVRAGISAQVAVYHAGVGPLAFSQLRDAIATCYSGAPWSLQYLTPLYFAQESFSARISNSYGAQDVVVFRYGDILGIVAARGYEQAQELASQWALRWSSVIQDLCLDPANTRFDATRQPLLRGIYKPYSETKEVRLPSAARLAVQQQEDSKARSRALSAVSLLQEESQATPYDVPTAYLAAATQPLQTPGEQVPMKDRPRSSYGLAVVIPDSPNKPEYPQFPSGFRETRSISGPVLDETGPGCGWALLGQPHPQFDPLIAEEEWGKQRSGALKSLEEDYRRWARETWDYAIAYQTYLGRVQIWNAWATLAALRVAEVDWAHYDTLLRQYEAEVDAYQAELDVILRCEEDLAEAIRERENMSPTPNPTPSVSPEAPEPTPSPTPPVLPPLPECEPRPQAPTPPVEPKTPRPPNMARS